MNKILLVPFVFIALLILQSCSAYESDAGKVVHLSTQKPTPTILSLEERANGLTSQGACEAEGGQWQKVGKLQREACILPAKDAGQPCTDSSQCEVACIAVQRRIDAGSKTTGQCQRSTQHFGCRTYVKDGVAEPTLCID
ncbi:Uncharacterised protein [BD1-7 clade bacterium]|uniref:Secreted protein n=1 Tax=BD1-7 clade bacterium TaxID=2029982 RepID=A0A5S9PJN9_9GAMM|nr:Uncharacterised protein [BD1-7 clade bacterium]CAA0104485.1 Uncharacterised protein [BD1-7 clade bacterium]